MNEDDFVNTDDLDDVVKTVIGSKPIDLNNDIPVIDDGLTVVTEQTQYEDLLNNDE